MALIVDVAKQVFDISELVRGTLIWAKHSSWEKGLPGVVLWATEEKMEIETFLDVQNCTNRFTIDVEEVSEGDWEFRWSPDGLETIEAYP